MAKIVKTDTQEAALKIIRENIKVLTGINAALNSRENNSYIMIIAGKRKISLAVETSFRNNVLKEIRKKTVAQTETLARKNAIKLDEKDIAVLKNLNEECSGKDISEHNKTEDYVTQRKLDGEKA